MSKARRVFNSLQDDSCLFTRQREKTPTRYGDCIGDALADMQSATVLNSEHMVLEQNRINGSKQVATAAKGKQEAS